MQESISSKPAPSFGRSHNTAANLEAQLVRRTLHRRLCERIKNYERIASRLEMRGEKDAATVLSRAANQLRAITVDPA